VSREAVIVAKSFTKEWIQAQRSASKGADPGLIEKQIFAFELLCHLVKSGKEFVFKGGTSLHLILPDHKRLSTDIDIVGGFTFDELTKLIMYSRFSRVEENVRKKKNIPKRHFKFFYASAIDGRESYVLLDTLEEHHTYPKLEEKLIAHTLFETDEEVKVSIPTLEGILGDKLTVFAPHTVGIPYEAGKSMEIVKQLFDIGELFDHCTDTKTMIESYHATQAQESEYRKPKHSKEASLDDTINTAFLVSQYLLKGYKSNDEIKEIATGLKQIENHLLGVPFKIDQARVAAAKIALLASLVKNNNLKFSFEKMRHNPKQNEKLLLVELSGSYDILNRLKKLNQLEAFYYWWLISQME
jgi:predicted nucleotidyltransferase component of viral defense system